MRFVTIIAVAIAIAVAIVVALAASARAGFDEGMAAYERGDFARARAFLDAHKIRYGVSTSTSNLPSVDIAARARGFTVAVECQR